MVDSITVTAPTPFTGIPWFDRTREWLARFPLSIIQLAGRIGVGAVFFKAGLLKYNSWEFTVVLFRDEYRVPVLDPALAARIAMVQELSIPILLFLGLATRLATLPLLAMIAVIQTFVYPNAYNDHLVWGAILLPATDARSRCVLRRPPDRTLGRTSAPAGPARLAMAWHRAPINEAYDRPGARFTTSAAS